MFFFCKQKTAYEMRISDWSSDVCSSDLLFQHVTLLRQRRRHRLDADGAAAVVIGDAAHVAPVHGIESAFVDVHAAQRTVRLHRGHGFDAVARSEKHTSELQSLMRISYAVFCLKKKK